MPSDNKPEGFETPKTSKSQTTSTQLANAMELPFTFVAAVAVGGLLGYFLDQWLHSGPWLMILFGGFGFAAGIIEIARRFRPKDSSSEHDKSDS